MTNTVIFKVNVGNHFTYKYFKTCVLKVLFIIIIELIIIKKIPLIIKISFKILFIKISVKLVTHLNFDETYLEINFNYNY